MKRYCAINIGLAIVLFCTIACETADRSSRRAERARAIGEYAEAAVAYQKAYRLTPPKERKRRGELAFSAAECYRSYGYAARALGCYQAAERYGHVDTTTQLHLGEMALLQGDYKVAECAFRNYLERKPDSEPAFLGLQSATRSPEIKAEGSLYRVQLAATFNSNRSDGSPVLLGTDREQLLFFVSYRNGVMGNELSGITGLKNGDLFVAKRDERGGWKAPEALPAPLNSEYDEGAPAFSPDGKTLYYTVCPAHPEYPRRAEIWCSERSNAAWGKPQPVKISGDTLSNYAHPAISPDGRWLYFVSDMPGGSGGTDLWRADLRMGKGVGSIENLGPLINTPGNEKFPSFRPNGELYFSSDGRGGMGGLDLYVAREDSLTHQWSIAPLPAPINSNADDFGITFDGLHRRGFFASSRGTGGRGWDKIYEFAYPEVLFTVKGWVYEQDGYELPASLVHIVGSDGTNLKIPVKPDGSFEQPVSPGVDYLFLATCKGYLNFPNRLHVDSAALGGEHVLQFPLPSLSIPVLVRNVFYEFDKADITPASSEALDRLAKLLTENAHITIELAAHTDTRGSEAYNLALSQRRAESVVRYLTSRGIAADRLNAKGYGETAPKVVNKKLAETHSFLHEGDTLSDAYIARLDAAQQDSCHALNRRTEFRVLRTTYGLFDDHGKLRPLDATPRPVPSSEGRKAEEEWEYVEE